jgi:hypothetical protein
VKVYLTGCIGAMGRTCTELSEALDVLMGWKAQMERQDADRAQAG